MLSALSCIADNIHPFGFKCFIAAILSPKLRPISTSSSSHSLPASFHAQGHHFSHCPLLYTCLLQSLHMYSKKRWCKKFSNAVESPKINTALLCCKLKMEDIVAAGCCYSITSFLFPTVFYGSLFPLQTTVTKHCISLDPDTHILTIH